MFGRKELQERDAEIAKLNQINADLVATITSHEATIATNQSTLEIQDRTLDSNRNTIDQLRTDLEHHQIANNVGRYALGKLTELEESGVVFISANDTVNKIVADRLVAQATAALTEQLMEDEEKRQRDEFGPEQIREIRDRLDETFKGGGIYDRIAYEIEDDIKNNLRDELIAQYKEKIRLEFADPDVRATMLADAEARLKQDGTFDRMRAVQEEAATKDITAEAETRAQEQISEEVNSDLATKISEAAEAWILGSGGQYYRRRKETEIGEQILREGMLKAAKLIDDQVTVSTLQEMNERTKDDILKELVADFITMGTDLTLIPEDNLIQIQLSNKPGDKPVKKSDNYGYASETVIYDRVIDIRSLGGGEYTLEYDSLVESKSSQRYALRLTPGETIKFGPYVDGDKTIHQTSYVTAGLPVILTRSNTPGYVLPGTAMNIIINKEHFAYQKSNRRPR